MATRTYLFDVATDHFQILFGDRERAPDVDTTHLWSSRAGVVMVPGAPELVGVETARFGGQTHVEVEVADTAPERDSPGTPVGSFAVHVPSGALVFWGPEAPRPVDGPTVVLPAPGTYQGTVWSSGVDAVTDEMAPDGPDRYRIVLWRVATNEN
jgi:hypothetical protein